MKVTTLIIAVFLMLSIESFCGQVYMWTDKKGVTHISDQPPKEDEEIKGTTKYREMIDGSLRQEKSKTEIPPQKTSPTMSKKQVALGSIDLVHNWDAAAGKSVMVADFTINNRSSYDIKDIKITCVHRAKSGTEMGSNTGTIYEVFKANSKRTIQNFNMGFIRSQAYTSYCKVTDLELY